MERGREKDVEEEGTSEAMKEETTRGEPGDEERVLKRAEEEEAETRGQER